MRPTPYEARERLLATLASALIFEMRDSHPTHERRERLAKLEGALDACSFHPDPMPSQPTYDQTRFGPGEINAAITLLTDAGYGIQFKGREVRPAERAEYAFLPRTATPELHAAIATIERELGYKPNARREHAAKCAAINTASGACDCGADEANIEAMAMAGAVVGAMHIGMVKRERCFERFMFTLSSAGFEVVRRGGGAHAITGDLLAAQSQLDAATNALRWIDERIPETVGVTGSTSERFTELVQQHDKMRRALHWALGEFEEFPSRSDMQEQQPDRIVGAYYWRNELRERAFGPSPTKEAKSQ